jgi:thiamine kinase-like enzyme
VTTPVAEEVWFSTMADAARLLRRYHDLTVGFVPPPGAVWRGHPADSGAPEVICHSDWAPHNAVWRDGQLVGIIDWDFARPGSRLYDLAWLVLMWCPLDLREGAQPGLAETIDQPARLRLACDTYGLADRSGVLAAVRARVEASVKWVEGGAAAGDPVLVKMRAEGHGEHYRRVLYHLEQRWDELAAAVA